MADRKLSERIALTEQEKRLIMMIRELKYGELHLFIAEGNPIRAEEIKKSIKL